MPRRVVTHRPRRPVGHGYVNALATGTRLAYQNRGAITSLGQKAKSYAKSFFKKKPVYNKTKVGVSPDRITEDLGTGGELTKLHVKYGGSKKAVPINKMVRSATQHNVFRWSAINPWLGLTTAGINGGGCGTGAGANWLTNFTTGLTTGTQYMPLHLYDLTSTNNAINGTFNGYNPSWGLQFNKTLSAITSAGFYNLQNQNNAGSTNTTVNSVWQAESTAGTSNAGLTLPNQRSLLRDVHIKIMAYGAINVPVEYSIEILQLKQDWLAPEFVNKTQDVVGGQDFNNTAIAFWESMVKKEVGHPIDSQYSRIYMKNVKVLKSVNFTIQPKLTNETVATIPHTKQIDMMLNMNRIMKFDWQQNNIDSNLNNGAAYQQNVGSVANIVHPKARIYLMIKATNTQIQAVSTTLAQTPSYDIVIRQSQEVLD